MAVAGEMSKGAAMGNPVLQIRIELQHIAPLIWRRLQMPGDCTFWDLYVAIQSAFAWNDTHLHEFRPVGRGAGHPRFGMPLDDFDENPPLPGWEHRVADVLTPANPRLEYEYGFGDGWEHTVVLEEVLETAPGKTYPRCTAGERSAPPMTAGGRVATKACSKPWQTPRTRITPRPMRGRAVGRDGAVASIPRPSTSRRSSSPIRRRG